MPLVRVEELGVAFADRPGARGGTVLDAVSFALDAGRTLGLVGESGSGKSLTCSALLGLLPRHCTITSGRMVFDDPETLDPPVDLARVPEPALRRIRGRRIAMIFQEPMTAFSPVHTVGSQIAEVCRTHLACDRPEARQRTLDMLARVGLADPAGIARAHAFELSGGMRQRAMIAMALVGRPSLLLADEPTTALDVTTQAGILRLLHDLQESLSMAILLVSHDLGVIASLAHDVAVLHQGRLLERGPVRDVLKAPGHVYTTGLLHAVPRIDSAPRTEPVPVNAPPILTVSDLSVVFAPRRPDLFARGRTGSPDLSGAALTNVDLQVKRGECIGIVGESGSGKSTLARTVMGAVPPTAGTLRFHPADGDALCPNSLRGTALKRFRSRVHYVFQDAASALNPRHTLRDILAEPLVIHGIASGAGLEARVYDAMDLVGLPRSCAGRFPHAFSGGQRQRIGIARALMTRPDLVLLDEPTSALDVSVQAQILALLRDLQSRLGLTYLFISHNLAVIDAVADRIAVMCRGRIVELAPRETLFRAPAHPYTKALLSVVPDPDRPLDLAHADPCEGAAPGDWPAPFTVRPGDMPALAETAPDHLVLQQAPQQTQAIRSVS